MSDTLSKILSILLWVLIGISVVLAVVFYVGGTTPESIGGVLEEPVYTDAFLLWGKILIIIAVLAAVLLPLIGIISNPKGAIKTLLGIAVIVIVAGVSYLFASEELVSIVGDDIINTPTVSKNVGTGLFSAYILGFVAFGSIIFTELISKFK